jgi:hypothetical protein
VTFYAQIVLTLLISAYLCFSMYVAVRAYFLEVSYGSEPEQALLLAMIVFAIWPFALLEDQQ